MVDAREVLARLRAGIDIEGEYTPEYQTPSAKAYRWADHALAKLEEAGFVVAPCYDHEMIEDYLDDQMERQLPQPVRIID